MSLLCSFVKKIETKKLFCLDKWIYFLIRRCLIQRIYYRSDLSLWLFWTVVAYPGADCACRTCVFACTASDTFGAVGILNRVYVHFACPCTCTAACTFVHVNSVSENRDGIKYGVYGSQRAYIFAKRTVNND